MKVQLLPLKLGIAVLTDQGAVVLPHPEFICDGQEFDNNHPSRGLNITNVSRTHRQRWRQQLPHGWLVHPPAGPAPGSSPITTAIAGFSGDVVIVAAAVLAWRLAELKQNFNLAPNMDAPSGWWVTGSAALDPRCSGTFDGNVEAGDQKASWIGKLRADPSVEAVTVLLGKNSSIPSSENGKVRYEAVAQLQDLILKVDEAFCHYLEQSLKRLLQQRAIAVAKSFDEVNDRIRRCEAAYKRALNHLATREDHRLRVERDAARPHPTLASAHNGGFLATVGGKLYAISSVGKVEALAPNLEMDNVERVRTKVIGQSTVVAARGGRHGETVHLAHVADEVYGPAKIHCPDGVCDLSPGERWSIGWGGSLAICWDLDQLKMVELHNLVEAVLNEEHDVDEWVILAATTRPLGKGFVLSAVVGTSESPKRGWAHLSLNIYPHTREWDGERTTRSDGVVVACALDSQGLRYAVLVDEPDEDAQMKRRLKILDVDSGRLTDHPLDPGPRIGRAVLTWWGDKVAVAHSLGGSGSVLTIDVVDGSKTRIDLNGLRVRELCGSGECLLALATNNQSVAPALYHWRKGSWSRLLEAPHADLTRRLESAPSAHVWSLTRVRESPPDSASKTGPAQDAKKRHLIKSWFALGGLMREIAQAATLDESPYVELVSRINQAVTDGDSWAVERMADLLSPLSALWVDPVNPGTPGAWQDVAQRLKSFVEADTTHVAMSGRLAVRFRELDPNLTQAQAEKMAERALGATEDVDWLSETDLVPRLAITIAHIDRRLQRIDGVKFE